MPDYRIYTLTTEGHIAGLPHVITCDTDQAAIEAGRDLLAEHDLEVWEGPRLVIRIKSQPGGRRQ
jgi:hypothetical protein